MTQKILNQVQELTNAAEVVVLMKFGSHMYGTETPESDTDYKGIYIPEVEDILLEKTPRSSINYSTGNKEGKNTSEDYDLEVFTLKGFFKLCEEGQVCALDMLFASDDMIIHSSPAWELIKQKRSELIHKRVSAFIGYCRKQTAKYGIKGSRLDALKDCVEMLQTKEPSIKVVEILDDLKTLCDKHPEFFEIKELEKVMRNVGGGGVKDEFANKYLGFADRKYMLNAKIKDILPALNKMYIGYGDRARKAQENNGVDFKAVSHAVRVCYQAIELLSTGHITLPLPNAEYIKDIKMGKYNYVDIAEHLEDLMVQVKAAEADSVIQENIDKSMLDALYLHMVLKTRYIAIPERPILKLKRGK